MFKFHPHQDRCSQNENDVNSTTAEKKRIQPQKYAFRLIDEANDDIIIFQANNNATEILQWHM